MRKTLWGICFLLMLMALPMYAAGAGLTMDIKVNADSGVMNVVGQHPSGEGKQVTILVLGPKGNIIFLDQTESGSDGGYLFRIQLTSAEYGKYEVRVGGEGVEAVTKPFVYENDNPPVNGDPNPGDGDDPGNGDPGGEHPGGPGGDDPGSGDPGTGNPGAGNPGGGAPSAGNSGGGSTAPSNGHSGTTITLKPTLKDGVATASMSEDSIQELLRNLRESSVVELLFDVENVEGAREVRVEFSSDLFRNGLDRLMIKTQFASWSIAGDAIPGLSEGEMISLSIKPVDVSTLPGEAASKLNGLVVYDFVLEVDGRPVHEFNGKTSIKAAIPFELGVGKRPETAVIYFVDEEGNLQVIKNSRYERGARQVVFYAEHLSKYAAGTVEVAFDDLSAVEWAHESIYGLAAREIVQGYGNGEFRPHGNVTRAEFLKMLIHAFDLLDPEAEATFADMTRNHWYYKEAATAARLNIVSGYPDGTFGGDRQITRQEMAVMAVMAVRAMQAAGLELQSVNRTVNLRDMDQVASYAQEAVLSLNRAGIIEGDASAMFRPTDHTSRAEAAKVLYMIWILAE